MRFNLIFPLVAIFFLFGELAKSQSSGSDDSSTSVQQDSVLDTILVQQPITITDDTIQQYKKKKDFSYIINLDSFLRHAPKLKMDTINTDNFNRVKSIAKDEAPGNQGSSIFGSPVVKVFFWVMAIAFLIFIVYKLFFNQSFFRRDPKNILPAKVEISLPNNSLGFDELIAAAVEEGDFRLAVRYLYLKTVQQLNEKGVIHFSPDKTNNEYIQELINQPYYAGFLSLTMNYEYVWYGRFEITPELFELLRKEFILFYQKLPV